MLQRPMTSGVAPDWPGALWVGCVDLHDLDTDADLPLDGGEQYQRARFLVRDGQAVMGFVTTAVSGGAVSVADLREQAAALPEPVHEPMPPTPPISVVICTRDRPVLVSQAIDAVLASDYPTFEVIVVDNASATDETREVALHHQDPRVRYVAEPRAGVSRGRNRGLRTAAYDIVAFVDDDVIADPHWLTGIARGFARADDVALVCALVASGEIRSRPQAWFDQRVTWADARRARQFRISEPAPDLPLFPFQVGSYGTGAAFAVRRRQYEAVGALDTAMGPGTPTMGGEDIDLFVRIIAAGWAVAVEPSAVVWHRHRDDLAALEKQAIGYGVGLGAWLAKSLMRPRLLSLAVPLVPAVVTRLRSIGQGGSSDPTATDREFGLPEGYTRRLGRLELRSALAGPVRYGRAVVASWRP